MAWGSVKVVLWYESKQFLKVFFPGKWCNKASYETAPLSCPLLIKIIALHVVPTTVLSKLFLPFDSFLTIVFIDSKGHTEGDKSIIWSFNVWTFTLWKLQKGLSKWFSNCELGKSNYTLTYVQIQKSQCLWAFNLF